MKRIIIVWLIVLVATYGFLKWQRASGPTNPKQIHGALGDLVIDDQLLRTSTIDADLPVSIRVAAPDEPAPDGLEAYVVWRRYPTADPWSRDALVYEQGYVKGALPRQPMAGKIEYHVEFVRAGQTLVLPADENAVARFKGSVPPVILLLHVTCMILGMLFSTGAGLEGLTNGGGLKTLSRLAFAFLFVGGLILGPLVQKYAFDALWTGWPLGEDWTDNKLAVGALVWLVAMWRTRKATATNPAGKWFAVAAMVVILVVYSIPHSIHGSTYDYETGEHIQVMMTEPQVRDIG